MAPSSIWYAASASVSPTRAATTCLTIASSAVTASKSAPWATSATTSRSEMMPRDRCSSPTTSAPTFSTHMVCATARSVSSGRANTGSRCSRLPILSWRYDAITPPSVVKPAAAPHGAVHLPPRPHYQCDADPRPRDRAEGHLLVAFVERSDQGGATGRLYVHVAVGRRNINHTQGPAS